MQKRELTVKKFKPLSKERLILSFDRLTRFKPTEKKYFRVFSEILSNNLIEPKLKKHELEELNPTDLARAVEFIVNSSLKTLVGEIPTDFAVNRRILDYETGLFNFDNNTKILVENKINYSAVLMLLDGDLPLNLRWLKLLSNPNYTEEVSHLHGLKFPIKKLVICEGITEEILLPEFSKILGYDFDKNGVQMISAGGKNQVVKMFYEYGKILKAPIFVLLDSDAKNNYEEIKPRLRAGDKVYLLKKGEFEDILALPLIEKTLKASIKNISLTPSEEPDKTEGMVHYLTEFYKKRGVHEFKKSDFALAVKENILGREDVSDEFCKIIQELKSV